MMREFIKVDVFFVPKRKKIKNDGCKYIFIELRILTTFFFSPFVLFFQDKMEDKTKSIVTYDIYWEITLKSIETTLRLLEPFQKNKCLVLDHAVDALSEIMKLDPHSIQESTEKPEKDSDVAGYSWSNYQSYDNSHSNVDESMEPHWKKITDEIIQIPLADDVCATCIAVSTEEGLENVIRDISQAPYIAIDCEMLGVKKNLPELKLLQIGVSSTKGYALLVDLIGFDALNRKLKPILEDDNINIVGWSYRSDGLAIESFFKQINQTPVLDLQAKLRPVAVSELNLSTAMDSYASSWIGIKEFQVAKRYGDSFIFTESNCVWLKTPLPPKALVYAVFDVLSVHALYEATTQYPSSDKFYWPYTITNGNNTKAVDKWFRQRHKGVSSSPYTPPSAPSTSITPKGKEHNGRNNHQRKDKCILPVELEQEPKTDDGYDDNNTRHQLEIQQAIALSLKDNYPVPAEDRVVGDLDENNTIKNMYYQEAPKEPEVITNTWGEINYDSSPFLGTGLVSLETSNRQVTPPIKSPRYSHRQSPTVSNTSNTYSQRPSPQQQYAQSHTTTSPRFSRPANTLNSNQQRYNSYENKRFSRTTTGQVSSPQQVRATTYSPKPQQQTLLQPPTQGFSPSAAPQLGFKDKPSKDKSMELTGSGPIHQTVSFAYSELDSTGSTAASWNNFANKTNHDWRKGIDTEVEEMEERFKNIPEGLPSMNKDAVTIKQGDNWSIEQDKPDLMTIPLKQIPIRKNFTGPRIMNPTDDYCDDEDDSTDSEEERTQHCKKQYKKDDVGPGVKVTPDMRIKTKTKEKKFRIEKLPVFVDDLYLYGQYGPDQLAMLKLTQFEHLDMIHVPEEPYTITVGFHLVDQKGVNVLKALQLYLSTGESYTCVLEQACLLVNKPLIKTTVFGKLLTDPTIKRICWCPDYIETQMIERLGFAMGPTLDLAGKINEGRDAVNYMSFKQAVDIFLEEWPDMEQYNEFKADYEQLNSSKKFSGFAWDRDRLPEVVLKYSALQGLACHCLYQLSKAMDARDEDYIVP